MECIFSISMIIVIVNQYITPLLLNTIPILQSEYVDPLLLTERHLKLAIPFLYLWILLFFAGFQFFPNFMAELTYFADRTFYKDWWNSRTFSEYWRLWNLPVHNFLFRHVYLPLRRRGVKKEIRLLIVFTISAIGHEYIVSGACRIVSYWAFLAMMM